MKIREANPSDKEIILNFCKNTFSWGDYIQDVWDFWLKEKNLFVVEQEIPLGICHAFFSNNQVWIEGIRINPSFRRKGLASKLISYVESIAQRKNIHNSFMLIDTENFSSLSMAKNQHYDVLETWRFYSLFPHQNNKYDVTFENIPNLSLSHYILSWRWLPLDSKVWNFLIKNKKIVFSKNNGKIAFAILTESEHFEKTLIVTFVGGSKQNNLNLILFLQNYGYENNFSRIQILTKEILTGFNTLEYRISFNLMQKSFD